MDLFIHKIEHQVHPPVHLVQYRIYHSYTHNNHITHVFFYTSMTYVSIYVPHIGQQLHAHTHNFLRRRDETKH